jgi:hypothetical protein
MFPTSNFNFDFDITQTHKVSPLTVSSMLDTYISNLPCDEIAIVHSLHARKRKRVIFLSDTFDGSGKTIRELLNSAMSREWESNFPTGNVGKDSFEPSNMRFLRDYGFGDVSPQDLQIWLGHRPGMWLDDLK